MSSAAGARAARIARSAVTTGGTVVAVAAVPNPGRRSHEEQQQLELGASDEGEGGATAPPVVRNLRWLA
jgi:hypothetical protein